MPRGGNYQPFTLYLSNQNFSSMLKDWKEICGSGLLVSGCRECNDQGSGHPLEMRAISVWGNVELWPLPPSVICSHSMTLWNPWLVEITGHPGRNPFLPVFQGVDKEKPIQAVFLVFCPGIFLPGCWGYFASATNAWF